MKLPGNVQHQGRYGLTQALNQNRGSGATITTTTIPANKPDEHMIELDDDSDLEIDEEAIKAVLAMPSSPERAPKAQN